MGPHGVRTSGVLIVIEGIDGAGSTTQTGLLVRWLKKRGVDSVATKEPTNGMIGQLIRKYLNNPLSSTLIDALLFAADRAEHVDNIIKPLLSQGKVVVSDRYVESSIAYQSSSGVDEDWLIEVNKFAPKPDLTIILDVPPDVALKRKNLPREKFEFEEFLGKVREKFLSRARKEGYFVVNAEPPIDEVQTEIRKMAAKLLNIDTDGQADLV